MAGSVFGDIFKITTWGESHGTGVGVVVDGCPAGLCLSEELIQTYMDRRKPGAVKYSTKRNEDDCIKILSGIFEGKTTGTPISMLVVNKDHRSADYSEIASYYRPGHADYTFDMKYGFRDYRGGGRSSGRETIGRVAAGAIAMIFLDELGISVKAYAKSIGPIEADMTKADMEYVNESPVYMPDREATEAAEVYLKEVAACRDSAGGVVECIVSGLPTGIGDPVFDKLDANVAKAVMSIGAVKGVEIGDGFAASRTCGSQNNDSFCMKDGKPSKLTNHSGGVLGGISDGSDFVVRAAFKPTPSVAKKQRTVNRDGEEIEIEIKGRHDPIIVPRAVVVVESMTAITIADMMLKRMTATMDGIKDYYSK